MARTPLFGRVLHAFRLLRGAAQSGVPVDEYAGRWAERRSAARREQPGGAVDRRRFLQRSATTVAATGFAPLVSAGGGGGDTDARVVIVGAGLAGLHCAYRLQEMGLRATVYEAATRVGGRVFTDRRTFPDGQHCELGGELIDTPHETMRDLAEELGIPLLDYATDDPRLADDVADIGGRKLSEAELLAGFAPIARAVDAALATLSDPSDPFVYYNKPNGGQALDALSLSAWLDRIGAAGPIRTLLEVAYTTEFGLDPGESNALNLVLFIGTDLEEFSLYGESDERFHARRGNDAFTTRLAEALRPGQIRLGHTLEAIRQGPNAPYVLTFVRDARRVDVPADHVVLALPFTTLRRVAIGVPLPPAKRRAIDELGYGTNTKLMGGLRSRVWRAQGFTGATFSDRGYQSSWDSSRLQPGSSGIITNFTGGSVGVRAGEGTPVQQLARFLDQFDGVFPGVAAASNGRAVRMHWTSYPLTLGSYSAYQVGQYTTIAGAEIERVGNLHFCGEHTSLDFQGYMEGGALTGAVAASELADDLGLEAADRPRLITSPLGARILRRARVTRAARRWHTALARSWGTA